MSNIADGIEYALQQARAARSEKTASDVGYTDPVYGDLSTGIKEAAQVFLADDEEDVTVEDLQALMREFS